MEDYLLVLMDSRLLISCVADFEEKVVVMCHGNIEIIGGDKGREELELCRENAQART